MKRICKVVIFAILLMGLVGCDSVPTNDITTGDNIEERFILKFDSNGGSEIADIKASDITLDFSKPIPLKEGYEFIDWYIDDELTEVFVMSASLLGEVTLYAKWQALDYVIYFEENGGSDVSDLTAPYQSSLTLPMDVTRPGYQFLGWYSDLDLTTIYEGTSMPLNGLTLYAKWQALDYSITFEENGGSEVNDLTAAYESSISLPNNLTKQGYEFDGWYTDSGLEDAFDQTTMPLDGATLYAKWIPALVDVTVNYYIQDLDLLDYSLSETLIIQAYTESTFSPPDKEILGFSYNQDHGLDLSQGIVLADGSLILNFYYNRNINTVSFVTNATISVESIEGLYESPMNAPSDPVRLGYTFIAWYADEALTEEYVFTTIPETDIFVYAKWQGVPSTIYFNSMNDGLLDELVANTGDPISLPVPLKEGYTFDGWYTSSTYQVVFDKDHMPVGGATLYAKWSMNNYTITYDTLGGTSITPNLLQYQEAIVLPTNPTKDGFIFEGWYLDESFLNEFNLSLMPANDLTLYAKWIDAGDPNSIFAQINQDEGSLVQIEATVYALHDTDYLGFYVYDNTGMVYVETNHSGLAIGDTIQISGLLGFDGNIPYIHSVGSIVSQSQLNDLPVSQAITLLELEDFTDKNIYDVYQVQGMLYYEDNNFYLIDYLTMTGIPIYYQSVGTNMTTTLNNQVGEFMTLDFTLVKHGGLYKATLISIETLALTDQDKLNVIEDIMSDYLSNKEFLPGTPLELLALDYFDLGVISDLTLATGDEQYFDELTYKFLSTDQEVTIPMTFTITIDQVTYDLTFNVLLKPIVITTIDGFINGTVGSFYQIEALVVSTNEEMGMMILKDDSGMVYAQNNFNLQVGDKGIFTVRKDLEGPMVYLNGDGDIDLYELISHENDLNILPQYLETADVLNLDFNDIDIYGQYVEVRGFIIPSEMDYEYSFALVTDDYQMPIFALGHAGFEDLIMHEYVEVIMRAFLYPKEDGTVGLYYEGKRLDMRIPDYTDQELLDTLDKAFFYQFSNKNFDSFEYFVLMPYHPVLGGEFVWEMDELTRSLYHAGENRFAYSELEVTLSFDITIRVGSVSKTINFNPKLNPISLSSFDYVKTEGNYGSVLVKGTVWYWHQDFIYLLNDQGELLFVDISGLPVYRGDEIILYASIDSHFESGEKYLRGYNPDDSLKAIISRNNTFVFEPTIMDLKDVLTQDAYDLTVYTKYIELSGKLIKIDDFTMVLETADGFIYLNPVDDYTYFELERLDNQFVTIRAYPYEYDDHYLLDGLVWHFRYLGMPGDLVELDVSDLEEIDYIEEYILTNYQITFESYHSFDFGSVLDVFPDATIVLTEVTDIGNLIDFIDDDDYYVFIDEIYSEQVIVINAHITVGTETRSFDFNFTVVPEIVPVVTSISDLILDDTELHLIEGQVVSLVKISSQEFVFLIKDATDSIFVLVSYSQYYDNDDWSGYIGETLRFKGVMNIIDGQEIFVQDDMQVYSRLGYIETVFTDQDIYSLAVENANNNSLIGTPISIQGMVVIEFNETIEYYLTDGNEKIRIYNTNYGYDSIGQYEGYIVTLNGFVYGKDDYGNMSIMYNAYKYNGQATLSIYQYSDQELMTMVKKSIEAKIESNGSFINENDYYYLPKGPSILQNHFTIGVVATYGQGSEFVLDNGNYIRVTAPLLDTELEITLTITIGELVETITYTIMIDGYTIGSLNDLFASNTNVDEVALEATVIHNGWSFHYFLIGGEVYYLNAFVDSWFESGDEVIIVGKKVIIDGISDYTYDISVITKSYGSQPNLISIDTSIENLYANDYSTNLLHRQSNRIYGKVGWDGFAGMYTLTHNGQMVYIRVNEGYEYYDYLAYYLNDFIYVNALLPLEYYRNEFMIVDIFGESDVDFPTYAIIDEVEKIKEKIASLGDIELYSGESLDDYIPLYNGNYQARLSFALLNASDDIYFDPSSYVFNFVDTETNMTVRVNISDSNSNILGYIDVNVIIKPRTETPIIDVLYGVEGDMYYISGIIIALKVSDEGDYVNMIVENGTERIIVEFHWNLDLMYMGDGLTLAVGDEIDLIGERAYYDHYGFVPNIYEPRIIRVISNNNTFTHTPISMTFEELLALDYTDPTIYTQYIEITGTIDWNGSSYYPTYYLVDYSLFDDWNYEYYSIELFGDTYTPFHTMMNPYDGQEVVITGYLIGFRYIYDHCDWRIYMEDITLVVE